MKVISILSIFVKGLAVNMFLVSSAYAYLDPGAGSVLLQGILAALAAILVTAKLYWHRLLKILGIRKSKIKTNERPEPAEQEGPKDN